MFIWFQRCVFIFQRMSIQAHLNFFFDWLLRLDWSTVASWKIINHGIVYQSVKSSASPSLYLSSKWLRILCLPSCCHVGYAALQNILYPDIYFCLQKILRWHMGHHELSAVRWDAAHSRYGKFNFITEGAHKLNVC